MRHSKTYIAVPPGETIREQLASRGMSQKEFAKRMNYSEKFISQLINGDAVLTYETADRLESVLGVPASFWNNLETRYRERLERVRQENDMNQDIAIAGNFPFSEMASIGVVDYVSSKFEKVREIRKFFSVARLSLIPKTMPSIACRRLSLTEKGDYALMVFVQKAKIDATKIDTASLNLKQLAKLVPEIKRMTNKEFNEVSDGLQELLAGCGVALVFMPTLSGSFLHGATFADGKKIVIGITARGRDADIFWFSLFHEIGHVLEGHYAKNIVTKEDEETADRFAADALIDKDSFQLFREKGDFSKGAVMQFASDMGINAGIVIGRLQKMKAMPYNSRLNSLKQKVSI